MSVTTQGLQTRQLNKTSLGVTMFQAVINKQVQELSNARIGMFTTLPRKPGSGDAEYVNRRASGSVGFVAETESPSYAGGTIAAADGAYTQVSFPYRTVFGWGQITRGAIARGKDYADLLATEIKGKTGDFSEKMEAFLGTSVSSSTAFAGLIPLVQATTSQRVVVPATGVASDDLDLVHLDKAISLVKGSQDRSRCLFYVSRVGKRIMNGLLQGQQAFNDRIKIAGGFEVESYGGVGVVESDGIPDIALWDGTSGTFTNLTGGASTVILCVNLEYVYISELTPMNLVILPQDTTQFQKFELYWDGAPVLANPLGASVICGIKTTGF